METLRAATPSLAMSARGGSLLSRVQRLLGAPTTVRRSPVVGRGAMLALLAVTLLIATWTAHAGDDAATTRPVTAVPADRRIAVGDRVRLTATRLDGGSGQTIETGVVDANGELSLVAIGRAPVVGRTAAEAGDALTQRFAREGRMPGARATFEIVTVAATKPAAAAGDADPSPAADLAVARLTLQRARLRTPLRPAAQRDANSVAAARDAIDDQLKRLATDAHVDLDDAARRFRALHAERGNLFDEAAPSARRQKIDVERFQLLRAGDYSVGGHVERPGIYSLGSRRTTLQRAILTAALDDVATMPKDAAGDAWIDVIARTGPASELILRFALADVLAGRHDDFELIANDQVWVGTNLTAPATTQAARRIAVGDRVRIVRFNPKGEPVDSASRDVSAAGTIAVPLVDEPVAIATLSEAEAAAEVAKRYVQRRGGASTFAVAVVDKDADDVAQAAARMKRLRDLAANDFPLAQGLAQRARLDTPLRPELQAQLGDDAAAALASARVTLDARIEERAGRVAGGLVSKAETNSPEEQSFHALHAQRARELASDAPADKLALIDATIETYARSGGSVYVAGVPALGNSLSLSGRLVSLRDICRRAAVPTDVERFVDVIANAAWLPNRPVRLRFDLRDVLAGRHDDFYLLNGDVVSVTAPQPGARAAAPTLEATGDLRLRTRDADGKTVAQVDAKQIVVTLPPGAATVPTDYRLATNDLVQIRVDELRGPGTVETYVKRLPASGSITLPMVGDVALVGKTEAEAAWLIAGRYEKKQVLSGAAVDVLALQRSDGINVPDAIVSRAVDRAGGTGGPPATAPADYRLAAGDLVRLEIGDAPTATSVRTLKRVSAAGVISVPYFEEVKVGGLTEMEAERAIARAYAEARVMPEAIIGVLAVQRSDGVTVPAALFGDVPATPAPAEASPTTAPSDSPIIIGDALTVFLGDARGGRDEMRQSIVAQNGLIQLDRSEKSRFPNVLDLPAVGRTDLELAIAIAAQLRSSAPDSRPIVTVHNNRRYGTPGVARVTDPMPPATPIDDCIAAGDLVRVTVYELAGPNKPAVIVKRVAADGTITLPYLDKPLTLAGVTPAAAERAIGKAYEAAQVLSKAQVDVLVVQSADGRSVPAGVLGATAEDIATTPKPAYGSDTPKAAATQPAAPATTRAAAGPISDRQLAEIDPFFNRLIGTRDEMVLELVRLQQIQGRGSPVVEKMQSNLEHLNARIAQIADAMRNEITAAATRPAGEARPLNERDRAARDPLFSRLVSSRDDVVLELARLQQIHGRGSPVVQKKQAEVNALEQRISQLVDPTSRGEATSREPQRR